MSSFKSGLLKWMTSVLFFALIVFAVVWMIKGINDQDASKKVDPVAESLESKQNEIESISIPIQSTQVDLDQNMKSQKINLTRPIDSTTLDKPLNQKVQMPIERKSIVSDNHTEHLEDSPQTRSIFDFLPDNAGAESIYYSLHDFNPRKCDDHRLCTPEQSHVVLVGISWMLSHQNTNRAIEMHTGSGNQFSPLWYLQITP